MKTFTGALDNFISKLNNKDPISVVRFGDGEYSILRGVNIDLLDKCNGEFRYDAINDSKYRKLLLDSFTYNHKDYLVGVVCPCCMDMGIHKAMKLTSGLPEKQLTWANIFVNGNYHRFLLEVTPLFKKYTVNYVHHKNGKTNDLPFKVNKTWLTGANSWKDDSLLEKVTDYCEGVKGQIFLFSCGPMANILAHQCHVKNPNNFYIDIGSVYDYILGLGRTRGYLNVASTLNKICVWE